MLKTHHFLLKLAVVLAIVCASVSAIFSRSSNRESFDDYTCQIMGRGHAALEQTAESVGVGLKLLSTTTLPDLWRMAPVNGFAEPLETRYLCRYASILKVELKKYPSNLLGNNLENIYLAHRLNLFGVDYGGTQLNKSLYLSGGSAANGFSNQYLANLIHHELSSIFFNRYHFPAEQWRALNPAGFSYATSNAEELAFVTAGEYSEDDRTFQSMGFISNYGRSTLENDFNQYAALLFAEPEALAALAKTFPAIARKRDLTIRFYQQISPELFPILERR